MQVRVVESRQHELLFEVDDFCLAIAICFENSLRGTDPEDFSVLYRNRIGSNTTPFGRITCRLLAGGQPLAFCRRLVNVPVNKHRIGFWQFNGRRGRDENHNRQEPESLHGCLGCRGDRPSAFGYRRAPVTRTNVRAWRSLRTAQMSNTWL